jgi:nitroreductase
MPISTSHRLLFVCSSGGHLAQLHRLAPWWGDHERRWVTFDKPDARSLLGGEDVRWAHHPTTRHAGNLVRNLLLAWRELRRTRPDVVISNGAGVAVPFFVLARLLGIRTVYVEVYDRIDSPTLTGRLCRPFTDLFCVQWPEQQHLYPGSVVVGRFL